MIFLNINNVEELIFIDKKTREFLPNYKYLFDSFDLSKVSPALKQLGVRCLNDFLKKIKKEDLIPVEKYLNEKIVIEEFNLDLVKNLEGNTENLEFVLPELYNNIDLAIYRKKDEIKVTLWK